MNEHFDMNRLMNLMRSDLLGRYRGALTVSGALAGLMVLQALLNWPAVADPTPMYVALLALMLFLWGPIEASHSFREMHDKTRNEAYLLLPASALEKVIARLLLVTVIFAIYAFAFTTLISWLSAGIRMLFHGLSTDPFTPLAFLQLPAVGLYVVNQSVFFLGGAWFRRLHLVKTGLALTVLWIGLVCFVLLMIRVMFPELARGTFDMAIDPTAFYRRYEGLISGGLEASVWLYHILVPVFCWTVAWMRVKEAQVSHGV